MKFNMSDLNPGVWFDLVEGEQDDGRICVRLCNGEALENIDKKTTKRREVYKRGQLLEKTDIDEEKRSRMIWDYSILDWEDVQDENGIDIPCTAENKNILMSGSPYFARLVSECLDKLRDQVEEKAAETEKN